MQTKKKVRLRIIMSLIAVLIVALGTPYLLRFIALSQSQLPSIQLVMRSGSQLLLNGHPFRFAGANMHWLALDDSGSYVPSFEVEDGFATAKAMGATVVRSHSLGISVGCPNCIEPKLGVFNQTAFSHVDYAIKVAREYGIHLVIPLTDNYHYSTGGKHTFTDWRNISNENDFYTNLQVIDDFKTYIKTLLNHVNTYTGIQYKDDPTIMAWETGNELVPPISWTQQISTYIKAIDQQHLVIDGSRGVDPHAASFSNVDIVSNHYYPMNVKDMVNDAQAAREARKAFIVGEFQWNDTYGGDSLESFLSAIMSNPAISGDLFWELWPHNDQYGFVSNQAKFTLHYPGDSPTMQTQVSLLRTHAFEIAGLSVPPEQVVGSPLLPTVIRRDSQNILIWRGAVGAAHYSIERSATGPNGPWTTICNSCATDMDTPWIDKTPLAGATWYRVIPYALTNVAGSSSNVYQARSTGLLIDNPNSWSGSYAHSSDLTITPANPLYMNGASSVITRMTATNAYVAWQQQGITSFQAITYFWPNEPVNNFSIYTSTDGDSWKLVHPEISKIDTNWPQYIYSINGLSSVNYVKIVWNNIHGKPWSPELGEVSISYNS